MTFRQSFSTLIASLVQLVHNRVELFGLEIAQEKDRGLRIFTQAAMAAIFLLLSVALITFLLVAIFWDTHYRLWVLAGLGVSYGLIGLVMLLRAKSNMSAFEHAFTATVDELRRDAQMFASMAQSTLASHEPTAHKPTANDRTSQSRAATPQNTHER